MRLQLERVRLVSHLDGQFHHAVSVRRSVFSPSQPCTREIAQASCFLCADSVFFLRFPLLQAQNRTQKVIRLVGCRFA